MKNDLRCTLCIDVDIADADRGDFVSSTRHQTTFSIDTFRHDRARSNGTLYLLGQQLARLVGPVMDQFTGTYDDLVDGVIDHFSSSNKE